MKKYAEDEILIEYPPSPMPPIALDLESNRSEIEVQFKESEIPVEILKPRPKSKEDEVYTIRSD